MSESVTPPIAACQASLSIKNSQNLLKLMSLSQWCHPTISSSIVPFSCLQSFPMLGTFPMSQLFTSGVLSIVASTWASVLPKNIEGWFPLGLTGLILQPKGLSGVYSSTTVLALSLPYGPALISAYDSDMGHINYFWNSTSLHSGRSHFTALPRFCIFINRSFVATLLPFFKKQLFQPFFKKQLFTSCLLLLLLSRFSRVRLCATP